MTVDKLQISNSAAAGLVTGWSRRGRFQALLDVTAWAVAIVAANVLRLDLSVDAVAWPAVFGIILITAFVQVLTGWFLRLYRGRYVYGSFEEIQALVASTAVNLVVVAPLVMVVGPAVGVPRSTQLIAVPIAGLLMLGIRAVVRTVAEEFRRPRPLAGALIYGAGELGTAITRRLKTDQASPFQPVGLIDDDPRKRHFQIRGVNVLGKFSDLPRLVEQTGATVLVVAIGHADATLLQRVDSAATELGLSVKIVPMLEQMLSGTSKPVDLRDLAIEDIVGRHPVDTNVESIASYLTGKRVLVTGAGGSIGLELCRQIHRFGPSELIMLDRDETGLQAAELATHGHGLLNGPEVVLADIREEYTLIRLFRERKPEVVFHAAALKHLPMLQQYPEEAWKTNVLGTQNVLSAARAAGVTTFVNISTDKAANPTSVLGHSKRLAERLTAWAAQQSGMRYLSVRFGNVLGSRGSMLPLFTQMIRDGGPVTVTHPDVTRYFMTIPEACQLVVQAGAIGQPGEVLILDMGEPVRILDVAKRMIAMSGRKVGIVFTGLREGEKLHELLRTDGEVDHRPMHPKISHAQVPELSPDELDRTHWLIEWMTETGEGAEAGAVLAEGSSK